MKPADYAILIGMTLLTALGALLIVSLIERKQVHSWRVCMPDDGVAQYCHTVEDFAEI